MQRKLEALKILLEKDFQKKGEKRELKGGMENSKKYTKSEGVFVYYDLEGLFHLAKQDYRMIIGENIFKTMESTVCLIKIAEVKVNKK